MAVITFGSEFLRPSATVALVNGACALPVPQRLSTPRTSAI
jgi:hypothetical protein